MKFLVAFFVHSFFFTNEKKGGYKCVRINVHCTVYAYIHMCNVHKLGVWVYLFTNNFYMQYQYIGNMKYIQRWKSTAIAQRKNELF